jgi:tRNA nucleotidyltransferase (CCA-adding enzyme)
MKIYLVGGAVRDQLLDIPVRERDWVVVGATEQAMLAAGYRRADNEFPVFLHPETGEEYALARTERKTGPGYRGFEVYAGPDVTLEQDLLRRDLTINALAQDEAGQLIDVCDGREDLDEGLLRHITPAFSEDPLRLLRVARFAAKLGQWGFRVAHGTYGLMKKMAACEDLQHLTAERVQVEMWKALAEPQPWRFFEVLHRCGALARLIPELAEVMGGQDSHQAAQGVDAMAALKRVVELTQDPVVRFGVAMFQAASLAEAPQRFVSGLRVGREAAELVQDLLELAPLQTAAREPVLLLRSAKRLCLNARPGRFEVCELAGRALWPDTMPAVLKGLALALGAFSEVDVRQFQAQGLQGADLGAALHAGHLEYLRARLVEESC